MSEQSTNYDPKVFWEAYRDQLREKCNAAIYRSSRELTEVAKAAAEYVITKVYKDLKAHREWLRLDCAGWSTVAGDEHHNWDLQIAFDHENGSDWTYELATHAVIASRLSVIAGYWNYGQERSLVKELQDNVWRLKRQIVRVPDRKWLFIFGPWNNTPEKPFVAYTFDVNDDKLNLCQLEDNNPLQPEDWPDFERR